MPLCRQPSEQWPFVPRRPRQGQSLGRHGSKNKSCPSIFPHRPAASPAHPAARPAAHTCSLPLAPGTQGGQHTALCSEEKGSNPTQSLCTAQGCSELALLDPIWDEGQSSAATTCQTPAQRRTPTRISHSDSASLSWSSIHSLETAPTRRSVISLRGPSVLHCRFHTPCCATL